MILATFLLDHIDGRTSTRQVLILLLYAQLEEKMVVCNLFQIPSKIFMVSTIYGHSNFTNIKCYDFSIVQHIHGY
jgi:hypothetical protein